MIDTIIVSGGNIQDGFALGFLKKIENKCGRKNIILIAADKGMEWFMRNPEFVPDLVVGDFDSLSSEGQAYMDTVKDMEILRLKPEKDDSDTQSAMNQAVKRGAKEILILGATGTRLDHVMANMGLMSLGKKLGVKVSIVDNCNYITLIPSGTILRKEEQFGRYVSFFSVGGDVTGMTLRGFKYPLEGYHLKVEDSGLTVSNEIQEETAEVIYQSGQLMMIMSRD